MSRELYRLVRGRHVIRATASEPQTILGPGDTFAPSNRLKLKMLREGRIEPVIKPTPVLIDEDDKVQVPDPQTNRPNLTLDTDTSDNDENQYTREDFKSQTVYDLWVASGKPDMTGQDRNGDANHTVFGVRDVQEVVRALEEAGA